MARELAFCSPFWLVSLEIWRAGFRTDVPKAKYGNFSPFWLVSLEIWRAGLQDRYSKVEIWKFLAILAGVSRNLANGITKRIVKNSTGNIMGASMRIVISGIESGGTSRRLEQASSIFREIDMTVFYVMIQVSKAFCRGLTRCL